MEPVDGRPLARFLEEGKLPLWRAIRWAAALASELAEAHREGVVHGHVNPDTVIVGVFDEITLRNANDPAEAGFSAAGLPTRINYLAPEQWRGEPAGAAADVFAFGAVAFVMFTGREAFPADSSASELLKVDPPRMSDLRPHFDAEIAALIDECLRKDPALRPAMKSAAEQLERRLHELEEIELGPRAGRFAPPPVAAPAPPPPPPVAAPAPAIEPEPVAMPAPVGGVVHTAAPTRVDENVQFSVYRPDVIAPDKWYALVVFAHLASRRPDMTPDEPDPLDEVERRARQIFGSAATLSGRADSTAAIPESGQIRIVPSVPGIEFNPPEQRFVWLESVHQADFRMRADASSAGTVARGRITVYLDVLPIAEMSISIPVLAGAADRAPRRREVINPYRKIFASYSHKDEAVVRQFEKYAAGMGDGYMRDVIELRAGEEWQPRLCEMIDAADVFQLFWSTNSMASKFVRQEWEHALTVDRRDFIRPLYWELPLPRREGLPPPSLEALHFAFVGERLLTASPGSEASSQETERARAMEQAREAEMERVLREAEARRAEAERSYLEESQLAAPGPNAASRPSAPPPPKRPPSWLIVASTTVAILLALLALRWC